MKLIKNDKEYVEYEYITEDEFEKDIIKNSKKIFGKKTIYIDTKKKLKPLHKKGSIPDGYLFDYTDEENPALYIIETELARHELDHIAPQLLNYAINYKHNRDTITEIIIKKTKETGVNLDDIAKNAKYRNADDMLKHIINEKGAKVIVPIDEITGDLIDAKNLLRFDIELIEIKKYISNDDELFLFEPFYEEATNNKPVISEKEINTIIVPAAEEGFNSVFIGQNCWYSVSIGINRIDKLKYIAAYVKSPTKSITHYAEISHIELYDNTDKYIIYFKNKAKKLAHPIKLSKKNPAKAPQGRVYTNINKIIKAGKNVTLDDIF